jgi:hypothetical protein
MRQEYVVSHMIGLPAAHGWMRCLHRTGATTTMASGGCRQRSCAVLTSDCLLACPWGKTCMQRAIRPSIRATRVTAAVRQPMGHTLVRQGLVSNDEDVAPGQSHGCDGGPYYGNCVSHHHHPSASPSRLELRSFVTLLVESLCVSSTITTTCRQPPDFPRPGAYRDHAASPRYSTAAWSFSLVLGLHLHHHRALPHRKSHSHGGSLSERRIECVVPPGLCVVGIQAKQAQTSPSSTSRRTRSASSSISSSRQTQRSSAS